MDRTALPAILVVALALVAWRAAPEPAPAAGPAAGTVESVAEAAPAGAAPSAAQAPSSPQQAMELEFLGGGPNRPFSEAVRVGNVLYLSGKIGSIPGQGMAEGGIQAETRATLDNIKAALERYGSSMDRVFKCLVILADMDDFRAMNEVYVTYFPGDKPARSAFAGSGLAAGALVEIECIAAL